MISDTPIGKAPRLDHPQELATKGKVYRFSGHQTFPLRISWFPKAIREIEKGRNPISNVDEGIVSLGLGKNMVEALGCWLQAFKVASRTGSNWNITPLGALLFGKGGLDPHMEDQCSAWLLHWLISTNRQDPFFAWECVFNRWPTIDFTASSVLDAFKRETSKSAKPASPVTLKQHWEVFLHTYRPAKGHKGEDHLDSALSGLNLIDRLGDRQNASGKWETLYGFDLSAKTSIPQQLFSFFLHDWWNNVHSHEQTVSFREVVNGDLSPGRILRMQEPEIVTRLNELARTSGTGLELTESANLRSVRRLRAKDGLSEIREAYQFPRFL